MKLLQKSLSFTCFLDFPALSVGSFLLLLEGTGAIWWRLRILLGCLLLHLSRGLFALLDVMCPALLLRLSESSLFWVHKQSRTSSFSSVASGFTLNT